jgi:hypothetical protein
MYIEQRPDTNIVELALIENADFSLSLDFEVVYTTTLVNQPS